MHIAFFDSGLGGLSIAKALFEHPLSQQIDISRCSYIADTGAFPYGSKNDAWLSERIIQVIAKSIAQLQPDLVVIACNTASTLALNVLRSGFAIPFVGVVPAIKPAALISQSGTFGILATPATIARDYTLQLIASYAPKHHVVLFGDGALVEQAERKILGLDVDLAIIQNSLEGLFGQPGGAQIDTVVLACTHFPLLIEELEHAMVARGSQLRWIDSGEAVARRVIQLHPEISVQAPTTNLPCQLTLVTTGGRYAEVYHQQIKNLCGYLGLTHGSSNYLDISPI